MRLRAPGCSGSISTAAAMASAAAIWRMKQTENRWRFMPCVGVFRKTKHKQIDEEGTSCPISVVRSFKTYKASAFLASLSRSTAVPNAEFITQHPPRQHVEDTL